MATPFLGEIRLFALPYAPNGWALCQGQLLSLAQNQALFALLGTSYGGNGTTTFGLPDLRGREAVGMSGSYSLGQLGGTETVTLAQNQIPAHTHSYQVATTAVSGQAPAGALPAATGDAEFAAPGSSALAATAIGAAGGGGGHDNMQPYLVLNYCIALTGVFPSRN